MEMSQSEPDRATMGIFMRCASLTAFFSRRHPLIGRAARARAVKDAPKARKEGQQRIAAQQVKPARAGGDTATQRGRQGDSVEKRLENVPI